MKSQMPPEITPILEDRISGSVALLERLIEALERILVDQDKHPDHFPDLLRSIRQELGHFAAIENFLESLIPLSRNEGYGPDELMRHISDYRARWKDSAVRIANSFLKELNPAGMTLLTHSHSQTIVSLLCQLHARQIPFRVLQTLSVPGEEGRMALEGMQCRGLEARLIDDAEVPGALAGTDLVLIGCDALLDHEFLNKTGTRTILEAAGALQVPRMLITESRKRIMRPEWKNGLAENPLFEWVPLWLTDALIHEGE